MSTLASGFANIGKIPELRKRILFAIAMLGVERGDYTAAYKVAGRFNVTSADNEIDPQGVADELWSYWKEQQKQTRGGEARITAMLKRHRNVYMAALAIAKSRAEGKKAKRR